MNTGQSLYQTVINNSGVRSDIHLRLSEDLETFTKPTLNPDDYEVTPKLCSVLMLCSRRFRDIVGMNLVERFQTLNSEILAQFNSQVRPDNSKAWCDLARANTRESRVQMTISVDLAAPVPPPAEPVEREVVF